MIRDMRDSVSSWPIRIVLIILIISFGIFFGGWGSGRRGQIKEGEVAKVNGEPIYAHDFSYRYQNLVQNYQRQGRLPENTPEMIYNILKQQLLNSMIYQKLKSSEAEHLSLQASNEKVKETIKKQFSDEQGNFNFKFYEQYLRNQMGKTTGQYEEEERESIRADLFEQFILETGLSSNLQLKQAYQQKNEKVVLSYVKLNAKSAAPHIPQVNSASDAELKKYYNDHLDMFKTKEKRKLSISYLEKKDFTASKDFTRDAEAVLHNEDTRTTDKRVKHVDTPMISYDSLVLPFTPSELTEILNSTSNLEVTKDTILISREGDKVYLVTLKEVEPAVAQPFETVKNDVKKSYVEEKNKQAYEIWLQDSWKNISSGKTSLASFAKSNRLEMKDTEAFEYASTNMVPPLGEQEEIMHTAFTLTMEKPYFPKTIKIGEDDAFVVLKKKESPDWKKFETETDNLTNVLHQESAQTRYAKWMENLEKKSTVVRELPTPQSTVPAAN